MLQTCIAEQQKLKMETAHHKLQYNLLSLQSEDDAKRSLVEHEMMRREVDALRTAEHSRQARRELSATADSTQAKYLQMKLWYEAAMEENESLHRRLKVAKKLIQQKEEETIHMAEERDMLLTRIRENREHFHMLCSPGGIFHSALTPRQETLSSSSSSIPLQHPASHHGARDHHYHHHTRTYSPRSLQREQEEEEEIIRERQRQRDRQREMGRGRDRERERERDRERERGGDRDRDGDGEMGDTSGHEHGLSALLQAMSQSQNQEQNPSAPSTPATSHRSAQKRYSGRHVHSRNAQSMSSLPTTPLHWSRDRAGGGLLPSADLVPQTEELLEPSEPLSRHQYTQQQFVPTTSNSARDRRRRSRESTISVDDNEELARQALESVEGFPSFGLSHYSDPTAQAPPEESESYCSPQRREDGEVFDSQASQAAAELLRRQPAGRRSLDMAHPAGSRDESPRPAEQSIKLQAKLLSGPHSRGDAMSKRKFSGHAPAAAEDVRREHGSPAKRARTAGGSSERRVGLGIQYGR